LETMIINQQAQVKYGRELQKVITAVVKATSQLMNLPRKSEVSILLLDNQHIQELNMLYRNQNWATDVLSFAMNELVEDEPDYDSGDEVNVLGDIVVSLEQAQIQSEEFGHSLARELGFLVTHGMLHLLGFDHETETEEKAMRELEEKILQSVNLER
jgi:probable rRNA maturation factor